MAAIRFVDDEAGYQRWLNNHPEGYVVNAERGLSPNYLVLHRAACSTIANFARYNRGAFTERGYVKICGETIAELRAWLRSNVAPDADFSSDSCRFCHP